jgi:hypothetical protein
MALGDKQDVIQIAQAAALSVVKQHMRAEAKAQASLAKKEMADKSNVVFAVIEKRLDALASSNARLIVLVDVLIDMACAPEHPLNGLNTEDRRLKIEELCNSKNNELSALAGPKPN